MKKDSRISRDKHVLPERMQVFGSSSLSILYVRERDKGNEVQRRHSDCVCEVPGGETPGRDRDRTTLHSYSTSKKYQR